MQTANKLWTGLLFLSFGLSGCGLAPSFTAATASLTKASEKKEHSDVPVEKEKEKAQDISSEPTSVGGTYLTCSTSGAAPGQDTVQIACNFDPKDSPDSPASITFAFSQGTSRSSALPLMISSSDGMQVDEVASMWKYTFRFSRIGLRGPLVFAEVTDTSKDPHAKYRDSVEVRGQEIISLLGPEGGYVGEIGQWPSGPSDSNCVIAGAPLPKSLSTQHAWPFEVKSDFATFNLDVDGVCGARPAIINRNSIEINATGVADSLHTIRLDNDRNSFSLRAVTLAKGNYQIFVRGANIALFPATLYDSLLLRSMRLELVSGDLVMAADQTLGN